MLGAIETFRECSKELCILKTPFGRQRVRRRYQQEETVMGQGSSDKGIVGALMETYSQRDWTESRITPKTSATKHEASEFVALHILITRTTLLTQRPLCVSYSSEEHIYLWPSQDSLRMRIWGYSFCLWDRKGKTRQTSEVSTSPLGKQVFIMKNHKTFNTLSPPSLFQIFPTPHQPLIASE